MRWSKAARGLAASMGFAALAVPAAGFAHHAFSAEFSRDLPVEVTGKVTKVEWTNPHARFYVDVVDEDGNTVNWDFELVSPNVLMRRGWTAGALRPGDEVKVNGFRARNAPNVGNASEVTLADGRRLFSDQNRNN